MSLVERVRRTLRRHQLLPSGATVAVAVSGGSDSVALLHLLLELQRTEGFQVSAATHVHHGLRGAEADRDEAFCRHLAERLGVELLVERVDVRAAAKAGRRSLEDAAREVRYEALGRTADSVGAVAIAVGHTRDDQAETVLLKLVRGAGLRGLGGIHPRRGRVVRPLLDCSRAELREWLRRRRIDFVEDTSNEDLIYARNRMRHEVLPALRGASGPSVDVVLGRLAEVARVEDAFLTDLADAAAEGVTTIDGTRVRLDLVRLSGHPPALQRRVVLSALERAGAEQPGFAAVDAVLRLGHRHGGVDLPGVRADRIGAAVVLQSRASARDEMSAGLPFRYPVPVPGRVRLPECGRVLEARTHRGLTDEDRVSVTLDRAEISAGLFVRSWRPGDWLRPVGLGGRKKVQDVFVDRKVPRAHRARVPLIVTAADRVIWVPGHAVDQAYRATAAAGDVVVLTLTELGGPE